MNYIEQFMKDNGLRVDTYFEIEGSQHKYVFKPDFCLWRITPGFPEVIDYIELGLLLTGQCRPVSKMEQVAEILGVKLDEEFNINKDGMEIPNGPFTLTEFGLEGKGEVSFPAHIFMKLLTGEHKIVPIEQEEA